MIAIKYLLLGYGKSNRSLEKFFATKGIYFQIYDDFLSENRIEVDFNGFDCVVKSGGIKNDHWILDIARKLNKEIISDLELFYLYNQEKTFITVTGTNGKTTTVNLLNYLLPEFDLGGNVGLPLFDYCDSKKNIIIEASSFMLEYTNSYRSKINVILNIEPNHLDYHLHFSDYLNAKLKLIKNAVSNDYLVYNADDPVLTKAVRSYNLYKIPFSKVKKNGIFISENNVYYKGKLVFKPVNLKLQGEHNLENIAAAIGAVLCYNPQYSDFSRINAFNPLSHRLEYLGKIGKIEVYNDSKATNLTALKTSLATFKNKKVILICGGKRRRENYGTLDDYLSSLDLVLVNGENKETLLEYFQGKGIKCYVFLNLQNLLTELKTYLKNQDVLLFSPGAVSYDQFQNFEERGNYFKDFIKEFLTENNN